MSSIDIKYYEQARELLDKGYMRAWSIDQLAERLSQQPALVNKNRPKDSTVVFNSKPNNPKPPMPQKVVDLGYSVNVEDESN